MTAPGVFVPVLLGLVFLATGMVTYRRDFQATRSFAAFGPAFVAAALAAFAGEHFTAAAGLAQLVPAWMPGRLFIAYFVGMAHLAAALSFVARRYVRWSAACLATMFALFVLLMDLPGALRHPAVSLNWILAARETTFAIGALALLATEIMDRWPGPSRTLATIARVWGAAVLIFYGIAHLVHPALSPGVPSSAPTAAWVPLPLALAYATGILLIAFGIAMVVRSHASRAAARAGWLMLLLTLALYVPQFFLARSVPDQVTAINFIFDTLLFAGMMFVISEALRTTRTQPIPGTVQRG